MSERRRYLIFGDVHYAGPSEAARGLTETEVDVSWTQKGLVNFYRNFIWLADPIGHARKFEDLIVRMNGIGADEAICMGDLAMDTAFVGLSDPATLESADSMVKLVQNKLYVPARWVMGDHELGKTSIIGKQGGPRIASLERWKSDLQFPVQWDFSWHHWRMVGICSTLAAFPVYAPEIHPDELHSWESAREAHTAWIRDTFGSISPDEKIVLFCHDPSALGYLAQIPEIRDRLDQIAVTWVGHMHSPLVEKAAGVFSGMPPIHWMGNSMRRFTVALEKARIWKKFNMKLCPSPSGSELLRDGGFYEMILHSDPDRFKPVCIFHPVPW